MNLLSVRRIGEAGCRILVRIAFLVFADTDGRRDINPSFQHTSIQEVLLACAGV